jgi:alkanesulfonate monooxygenase SsuD/methylene tetrahydromethanopterin reductase-like flavin-dependent oxidoreductase (luciferase family)
VSDAGARGSRPSFGVVFPAHAQVETLPAFARRTEELGFDELWLVEDCFLSGGLVMAATALAATRCLRIGLGLMAAPLRNPALAAMEIATLARLYPGRFRAAFGHGVREWMAQSGALPQRRVAALAEVTSAVRALLAGDTVTTCGSHVKLTDVALERAPEPPPPILIGTTGPRGLALAGALADGFVLAEGSGPAFISRAVAQASAAAAGRGSPSAVVYAWLRLEDDDERARMLLRPVLERWIEWGLFPEPAAAAGIVAPLRPGPVAPSLAAELAVVGDPPACAASVRRLVQAGAQTLVLAAIGGDHQAQYERFGRELLPQLRRDPGEEAGRLAAS